MLLSLWHQGALRVSRFNPFEGCVGSDSVGQDILVSGRIDMNRALDGAWREGRCEASRNLRPAWLPAQAMLSLLSSSLRINGSPIVPASLGEESGPTMRQEAGPRERKGGRRSRTR